MRLEEFFKLINLGFLVIIASDVQTFIFVGNLYLNLSLEFVIL
jgi:hypothetical protein